MGEIDKKRFDNQMYDPQDMALYVAIMRASVDIISAKRTAGNTDEIHHYKPEQVRKLLDQVRKHSMYRGVEYLQISTSTVQHLGGTTLSIFDVESDSQIFRFEDRNEIINKIPEQYKQQPNRSVNQ